MQAFASDIDGTLVFHRHVHQHDKQAIKKYRKNHLFQACDYSFTFHSSPLEVKQKTNECVHSVAEAILRMEESK